MLKYIPENIRSEYMCNQAVYDNPLALEFVPFALKISNNYENCKIALQKSYLAFKFIPEGFYKYETHITLTKKIINEYPDSKLYISTQTLIDIGCDDDYDNDNEKNEV